MKKWQGYIPTPTDVMIATENLIAKEQGSFEFCDLAPHLKNYGAGQKALLFMSAMKFQANIFEDEPQIGPDCTSHATRNAMDLARSVEIDIKGDLEEWVARGATEGIYGYRGSMGQGMNPGLATQFLIKYGMLLRQKYPFADLSKYTYSFGESWGRSGPPAVLLEEAKKHPCKYFARIRSVEEARAALAAGYGIHCGSQYGNDGRRDSRGVSIWNDSWNHDMAWGGYDDTGADLFFIILQSWGRWNSGGMPLDYKIPGGSFLIPAKDATRMIAGGECWAVGDTVGWPAKDLPNYGSGDYL